MAASAVRAGGGKAKPTHLIRPKAHNVRDLGGVIQLSAWRISSGRCHQRIQNWLRELQLHEALLVEQLGDLREGVGREVDALALATLLVQDHKVRVVVVNPLHLHILVLLPSLVLPEELPHLRELVQLSPAAGLEAPARGEVRVHLLAVAVLAVAVREASLRLALGVAGMCQQAQQHRGADKTHRRRSREAQR
jgi:hypothetical protein